MKTLKVAALGVALLGLGAQSAQGAIVQVSGATVDFVYDTADISPLFGSLYVSGDTIFALPTTFAASSTDGVGAHTGTATDLLNAIGTIQIVAKTGYQLDGITISERGIYNMTGGSSVGVDASLRLFDWNDPAPIFGTEEMVNMTSTSDFTLNDGIDHSWSASGGFDMTTATWSGVSHVGLTLSNTLTATSAMGDIALIQKEAVGGAVGISIDTTYVPVPAALWLFGSGLIGLAGFARRKSA